LKSVSTNYISGKLEKIEVFRSRGVIRITSTRDKSAYIVQAIGEALRSVSRLKLPLEVLMPPTEKSSHRQRRKWVSKQFNDEALAEIAQLTNTEITTTASGIVSPPVVVST